MPGKDCDVFGPGRSPQRKGTILIRSSAASRTVLAVAGPFASSAAQFLLSFVLLHTLPAAAFGGFSFLLIASQFTWALAGALVCAPLPLAYQAEEPRRSQQVDAMFAVNAACAATGTVVFVLIALLLTASPLASVLFGTYAGLALVRWFARADAYARGKPFSAAASDVAQATAIAAGAGLLLLDRSHALTIAIGALLAGTLCGLLPFGVSFWHRHTLGLSISALSGYRGPWRDHGRWALLGIVTTEVTANAHSYIVTLFLGPRFFAPIAASSLGIRPITVTMNALGEFERARMVRDLAAGATQSVAQAVRFFRGVLALAWVGSAAGVAILLLYAPKILAPPGLSLHDIVLGSALWMACAAVRAARTPDSVLLQASGAFEPLAYASIVSAFLSVLLVAVLVMTAGPIWSLLGILFGELVFALAIFRQTRRIARHLHRREQPCHS